ncbi:MAG TPA: hypothetical protein VGD87_05380, partial [Archangium sp.]
MHVRVALLCLLAFSACVTRRGVVIGEPSPVVTTTSPIRWRVGSLLVAYQLLGTFGNDVTKEVDGSPLEQGFHDRLRATLAAQQPLGFDERTPQYTIEVDVSVRERSTVGRQLGLGIGLQLGISVLGMVLGPVIGLATKDPSEPAYPAFLRSFLAGTGVGLAGGVFAAMLPESSAFDGQADARLVLRRLSDRAVVGERRVQASWRSDFNAFGVEAKLDHAAGRGAAALEQAVLEGLQSVLQ